MRCLVLLLRRHGLRLKQRELPPPVQGDLELTDAMATTQFRRLTRVANLWADAGGGTRRSLLIPLWEPSIVRIGPSSMALMGVELDTIKGRVHEHMQVWRCVPVPSEGSPP